MKSSSQLVFTDKNISTMPAIQVRWVVQPSREGNEKSKTREKVFSEYHAQRNMTSPCKTLVGGFKMRWQVTAGLANVSKRVLEWKTKNYRGSYKRDLNILTIISLVRESKVRRVDDSQVWKTLLKHRWDVENLKTNSCLDNNQILGVIFKTGQSFNLKTGSSIWNWISDDDLAFGLELFSALHYCPESLV